MVQPRVEGLTVKAAVLAGFGLTLGLWLFVGYQVTGRMAEVERQAAEVNVRYMLAQELLATVRSQVLLGSVYVRDALLDPDPSGTDYATQLEATYRSVDAALEQYVPILDSAAERARVDRLRKEIDQFRTDTLQVLRTDSSRWPDDARDLLRRLMPKREAALRLSDEVQALNRVAFVQQQAAMADVHESIQRQVWTRLGIAVGLSLGIALLASTYAGRLERRLREQRAKEEQHAADLQRLSARLVDAQEDERRRIARELHDEVGQLLSAVKVELSLAQRRIQGVNGASPGMLDDAQALADTALHTVRDMSHLLHPPVLDDLGLAAALGSYTAEFGKRHGIAVDFSCRGLDERLPPEVESAAYRIVQEALTNIARHARADACTVCAERAAARLVLTITDDGIGFDVAEVQRSGPRGLGLVGIRERVSQLHGTVSIESVPLTGTRIVVKLPVPLRTAAAPASPGSKPLPAPAAPEALHG